MAVVLLKKPDSEYFCIPVKLVISSSSMWVLCHDKQVVQFEDPETGEKYNAIREDFVDYPFKAISDFHSKVCLQMTAFELKQKMIDELNLLPDDTIAIVQYRLIP